MDRAPIYPTMDLDAIKTLPRRIHRRARSVLFLWATGAMKPQALEVMGDVGVRVP